MFIFTQVRMSQEIFFFCKHFISVIDRSSSSSVMTKQEGCIFSSITACDAFLGRLLAWTQYEQEMSAHSECAINPSDDDGGCEVVFRIFFPRLLQGSPTHTAAQKQYSRKDLTQPILVKRRGEWCNHLHWRWSTDEPKSKDCCSWFLSGR